MTNQFRQRLLKQGSVLIVTLFLVFMFGAFLFYYLNTVRSQNTLVVRAQAWNGALALAEAGVEEALAQLNPGAPQPVIDRTANGWGAVAGGLYGPISRTVSSGSYSVVYTDDKYPVIYSTGYVAVAAIPATLSRTLRVGTTNLPLFMVGMAAHDGIDLKGNGVGTDSFNSADPNLSQDGRYVPSKTSTNGDIATFAGVVNVGNADVHGDVLLGPTATDTISKNGVVTGGTYNDFNFEFESVVLPQTTWLPALMNNAMINGTNYTYAFTNSGDYIILTGGNIYVAPGAKVRLKVTDNNFTATYIEVDGTGNSSGSLAIYMTGQTFTVSGGAAVDGGVAKNLSYYGTDNNTAINFTGNASFTGTIYAPQANFKLGGGGSDIYDFVGASVTKTVTMNGHFNFHFDEDLLKNGPVRGYTAWSWDEI